LQALGSLNEVARANTETLIEAGLPKSTAQKVFSHFHPTGRDDPLAVMTPLAAMTPLAPNRTLCMKTATNNK
jgi:hypothetical protein